MIRSYLSGWKNSFNYSKRTNRKTFFKFVFIDLLIMVIIVGRCVISVCPEGTTNEFLFVVYNVLAFFPRLGICARRIKDTGKSTNWMLFSFMPGLGWFILFIIFLQESISNSQELIDQSVPIKIISNTSSQNENPNTLESKIEELKKLKEKGIISDEEYEQLRKKTLDL